MSEPMDDTAHSTASGAMQEMALLWTQSYHLLAAFVASAVPNFHDAEDIMQQTAVAAATRFADYDRSRPFSRWVIGIARHKILNHQQKRYRDRHVFSDETLMQIAEVHERMEEEDELMKLALRKCIEKVGARSRQLLELRYTRELKPARIADKMGMAPNAVSAALSRVRQVLEACIRRTMNEQVSQ